MKYYFKSNYEECFYSQNWYATLNLAPNATILFYDDNDNFCIGYVESEEAINILNGYNIITTYETEEDALADIDMLSIEDENIWFGDRLDNRWMPEEEELEEYIEE